MKKTKLKSVIFCMLCIGMTVGVYQVFVIPNVQRSTRETLLAEIKKDGSVISTVVLQQPIGQGDILTDDLVQIENRPRSFVPDDVLSSLDDVVGKVAKLPLGSGTSITEDMIIKSDDKLTKDLRIQDYDYFVLNNFLAVDDYFDVRFLTKDGEDYVVASKLKVVETDGSSVTTNILEEQRFNINSATVDAATNEGKIYTTVYADPEKQPKAKVTYVPSDVIKKMIDKDPNIISDAQQQLLERRDSSDEKDGKKDNKKEEDRKNNRDSKKIDKKDDKK